MTTAIQLTASAWLFAIAGIASASDRPPNFIIINCDDLGYGDVGSYGATQIRTPHIDRLAAEGMRLTNYHNTSSVCSPSRASLLTGRYPQRTGVHFVIDPRTDSDRRGIREGIPTIADILKRKGYATACIGKWHVGHRPEFLPTSRGFDVFEGIPLSNDMPMSPGVMFADDAILHGFTIEQAYEAEPGTIPWMRNEKILEFPMAQDDLTRRCTQESLAFIEDHRDQPFFLYLAHPMPHLPLAASPRFRGKSAGGLYGDAVEEIDWSVGQIDQKLKELGLRDRTLIFFTSDNGPRIRPGEAGGNAGPFRGGKAGPYEGGSRVPAIVRFPGVIPEARTSAELVTAMDLLPTLAGWAGAELPADLDGFDVRSLLKDDVGAKTPYDLFFGEGTVRREPLKLILLQDGGSELYHLENDPRERHDLSQEMPQIVVELYDLMPRDLVRPPRLPMKAQWPAR